MVYSWFVIFKYSMFALLTLNILLFGVLGTLNEALDCLAWVILLLAFEYETTFAHEEYASLSEKFGLWGVQALGYGLGLYTTVVYYIAGEWPDTINAASWLGVCLVLLYEVHASNTRPRVNFFINTIVKVLLYLLLVAAALYWGYMGMIARPSLEGFLRFFDAVLWIVCFVTVEMNMFGVNKGDVLKANEVCSDIRT
jgi:hypothetical protein